jgi:hypothetical protein
MNEATNEEQIKHIAHTLYLADVDYDGHGGKYVHLARAVLASFKSAAPANLDNAAYRPIKTG